MVKIGAVASLIMICTLFGAGMITLIYALVLEASTGEPGYVILAGIGTLLVVIATFIAIIQQKIEKL